MGYWLKPEIPGVERYLYDFYLMFLSREIDKINRIPPMVVQYTGHVIQTETCDNNTLLLLVGVLVMCPNVYIIFLIISIKKGKLLNLKNNRSKPKIFRLLRVTVVTRLVAYLLNMICLTLIQNFTDVRFCIILTQFNINFSRQENQIELCNRSQSTPEIFRFKPIPPFKCIYVCIY